LLLLFGIFLIAFLNSPKGPPPKKTKKTRNKKQKDNPKKQPTGFPLKKKKVPLASAVGRLWYGGHATAYDTTFRSWLWGIPLRASSL
jgi:hypothetical protein